VRGLLTRSHPAAPVQRQAASTPASEAAAGGAGGRFRTAAGGGRRAGGAARRQAARSARPCPAWVPSRTRLWSGACRTSSTPCSSTPRPRAGPPGRRACGSRVTARGLEPSAFELIDRVCRRAVNAWKHTDLGAGADGQDAAALLLAQTDLPEPAARHEAEAIHAEFVVAGARECPSCCSRRAAALVVRGRPQPRHRLRRSRRRLARSLAGLHLPVRVPRLVVQRERRHLRGEQQRRLVRLRLRHRRERHLRWPGRGGWACLPAAVGHLVHTVLFLVRVTRQWPRRFTHGGCGPAWANVRTGTGQRLS